MSSVKHNRIPNPYAAGTQMNMCHSVKWEDKTSAPQSQHDGTPNQQRQGADSRADISDSRQDCVTEGDSPKDMTMKSSQDSTKGKIRTRS